MLPVGLCWRLGLSSSSSWELADSPELPTGDGALLDARLPATTGLSTALPFPTAARGVGIMTPWWMSGCEYTTSVGRSPQGVLMPPW